MILKSSIRLIVASGATRAIRATSSSSRNRCSTFTMSFFPIFELVMFIANVTMFPSSPVIPSILRTSRALPALIWSITVPSWILTILIFSSPTFSDMSNHTQVRPINHPVLDLPPSSLKAKVDMHSRWTTPRRRWYCLGFRRTWKITQLSSKEALWRKCRRRGISEGASERHPTCPIGCWRGCQSCYGNNWESTRTSPRWNPSKRCVTSWTCSPRCLGHSSIFLGREDSSTDDQPRKTQPCHDGGYSGLREDNNHRETCPILSEEGY